MPQRLLRALCLVSSASVLALVPNAPHVAMPRVVGRRGRALAAVPPPAHSRSDRATLAATPVDAAIENSIPELAEVIAALGAADLGVLSELEDLRSQKFFALYSIDMLANCAYLKDQLDECEFDACEVLPEEPAPLRLFARDLDEREFDLDAWARLDLPSEDYYDLEAYPEGYTGYDGSHVWRFIYEKLAFAGDAAETLDADERENGWRAVFDRAVSGLHASIACHVVDDFSDDDDVCLEEYARRVGDHPDRGRNLHFAFALVLTALREARPALATFAFDADDAAADADLRARVDALAAEPLLDEPALARMAPLMRAAAVTANECVLADDGGENEWLEEAGIWQMRQRSRAMLRVMDCVQCGACRIHGKVAWFGIATALRLIYDDLAKKPLARVEVAALLTTLAKLGTAVRFAQEMESLAEETAGDAE